MATGPAWSRPATGWDCTNEHAEGRRQVVVAVTPAHDQTSLFELTNDVRVAALGGREDGRDTLLNRSQVAPIVVEVFICGGAEPAAQLGVVLVGQRGIFGLPQLAGVEAGDLQEQGVGAGQVENDIHGGLGEGQFDAGGQGRQQMAGLVLGKEAQPDAGEDVEERGTDGQANDSLS